MARGSIEAVVGADGHRRYRIRYDLGTDPRTGRRRQGQRTLRTRVEAERTLASVLTEVERGEYIPPLTRTVAELLEEYCQQQAAHWAIQTRRNVETRRRHLVAALGPVPVQQMTPSRIRSVVAEWSAAGMARESQRKILQLLHAALDRAVTDGWLRRNPAEGIAAGGPAPEPLLIWTPEQAASFLAVTDARVDAALWRLLVTLGPRHGEVRALCWEDVQGETLLIRAQVRQADARRVAPKTAAGVRALPLSPTLVAQLRRYRAWQAERKLALGPGWQHDGLLLFTGPAGRMLVEQVVNRTLKALCREAGVPELSVHGLRHVAASTMLAAGVSAKTVQTLLGHASVTVTLNIYTHVTPAVQRQAVAAVDALLDAG